MEHSWITSVIAWHELSDDDLVVLAQKTRWRSPVAELTRRHADGLDRLVSWLAARFALSREDAAEARQQANLVLVSVVLRYKARAGAAAGGSGWRRFLHGAVRLALQEFARKRRREERHLDRSLSAADALEGQARHHAAPDCPQLASPAADPATAAEWRENEALVQRALDALPAGERWLWESVGRGRSLKEIADEMGVSYATVRRHHRAMRKHLLGWLGLDHDGAGSAHGTPSHPDSED
jgi:RNA polymerase sigma factor (sigma-70 family)